MQFASLTPKPTTAHKGMAQPQVSFLDTAAARPPPKRPPVALDDLQALDEGLDLETL